MVLYSTYVVRLSYFAFLVFTPFFRAFLFFLFQAATQASREDFFVSIILGFFAFFRYPFYRDFYFYVALHICSMRLPRILGCVSIFFFESFFVVNALLIKAATSIPTAPGLATCQTSCCGWGHAGLHLLGDFVLGAYLFAALLLTYFFFCYYFLEGAI